MQSVTTLQIFSPCIVASTFLLCFMFLNSKNHIPCHVPVANFPFEIGMLTLAPMSDDFMCALSFLISQKSPILHLKAIHRHIVRTLSIVPINTLSSCPTRISASIPPSPIFETLLHLPFPSRPLNHPLRQKAISYLYPPPQSHPTHHSYPP